MHRFAGTAGVDGELFLVQVADRVERVLANIVANDIVLSEYGIGAIYFGFERCRTQMFQVDPLGFTVRALSPASSSGARRHACMPRAQSPSRESTRFSNAPYETSNRTGPGMHTERFPMVWTVTSIP